MSQETTGDAAPAETATATHASAAEPETATTASTTTPCQSPPAAPMPAREQTADPRVQLLELAAKLMRSNNRRLIVEYLRLRRAIA